MNILFAMPWAQRTGGVTHAAVSLARELQARGHPATFLFPSERGFKVQTGTSPRGFPSIYARFRNYATGESSWRERLAWRSTLLTTLPQLARKAAGRRIDLINVHYPDDAFALLVDLARRLRVPFVVSVHGSDLLADSGPRRGIGLLRQLNDAPVVVAPSESFLNDVVAAYPSLKGKTRCIYNGYDSEEVSAIAPVATSATGSDDVTVLCVAALIWKKGLDVLLHAIQKSASPRLKLRLVGEGPLRQELEALSASLGLATRVSFLGPKERAGVFEELDRCDIFALPSRHPSESFGLAALEAMALAKPVVASAIGGLPEVVVQRETGLLVPPEDPVALAHAIDSLASNPALRAAFGLAGRARASRFTVNETASQYEALFRELVSGRASTA